MYTYPGLVVLAKVIDARQWSLEVIIVACPFICHKSQHSLECVTQGVCMSYSTSPGLHTSTD